MNQAALISLVSLVSLAGLGCRAGTLAPTSQIVVPVDTDAPVPSAAASLVPLDATAPLFDTLQVDLFAPGEASACAGCSNTFALDEAALQARTVSFGVAAPPGVPGYRMRLRMYPSWATLSGAPPEPGAAGNVPDSVVDTIVDVPVVGDGQVVDFTVLLATDTVGVPVGSLAAPASMTPGAPAASMVGTWPSAARVPCAGQAPSGTVCIPGGAFWMGNAKVVGEGDANGSDELRLVVVSPFFLDATEVTVGRLRAGGVQAEVLWSGSSSGTQIQDFCTDTAAPAGREDVPVNCIGWMTARSFCVARGGDLPTEAQFEYVASAFQGRSFVWGEDAPACPDAVLEGGGWGLNELSPFQDCKPATPPGGPLAVGTQVTPPRRDRLELATGTVYDLVGNVQELTRDLWNRQDEACWSTPGVYRDPLCASTTSVDAQGQRLNVVRGGCYLSPPRGGTAAVRTFLSETQASPEIGFRCATP